ncbi:MAG: hypothetical protein ABL962_07740 [Fimbriimonadaceae bacterium]
MATRQFTETARPEKQRGDQPNVPTLSMDDFAALIAEGFVTEPKRKARSKRSSK